MYPHLGPVKAYPVLYVAAILLHAVMLGIFARHYRLGWWVPAGLGVCFAMAMTAGAKLLFDLAHGLFRMQNLLSWSHYVQGGMWGGVLAYLAMAVPLAWLLTRRRGLALDVIAFSLPLPMILAKIGCFCQGCCHGRACSAFWALTFPSGGPAPAGVPLHPTQVYEIFVLGVIALALARLNRPAWRGLMLAWFILLYGIGRCVVEIYRGDARQTIGPLSTSQIVLLTASVLAAAFLLERTRSVRRPFPPPQVESSGALVPAPRTTLR